MFSIELPASRSFIGRSGREVERLAEKYGVRVAWISSPFKRPAAEVDLIDEESVIRLEADDEESVLELLRTLGFRE